VAPQPNHNRSQPDDKHLDVFWAQRTGTARADPAEETTMSGTIHTRIRPLTVIAAALLTAGAAGVVVHGGFTPNPRTTIDVPRIQRTSGPAVNDLTSADHAAAQRIAELRAQRAADFWSCLGPAYPVRPC
jgi:hypothetical protein